MAAETSVMTAARPHGKTIETPAEYAEALQHAGALMNAAPGSADERALDGIVSRTETYEAKYEPMREPGTAVFQQHLDEASRPAVKPK